MTEIINYFLTESNLSKQTIPKQVVNQIARLNKAGREKLRHQLFAEAGNKPDSLLWLQRCFELIDLFSFRFNKVFFSPGHAIKENILLLLEKSIETLDLCIFTITDKELAAQILAAHKRGVKVRIITDDEKTIAKGSEIYFLENNGLDIKIDHSRYHMHNKFGVIDNHVAITGSFNWTYTATKHNQENLLATSNFDIVNQYHDEFNRLWKSLYNL